MKRERIAYLFLTIATAFLIVFLCFLPTTCSRLKKEHVVVFQTTVPDTIRVLLFANTSDYFIYKGVPMGFQYELLQEAGKALGKTMRIAVERDYDKAYLAIFSGKYDIIAMDHEKNQAIDYYLTSSVPHSSSYPVLVERTSHLVPEGCSRELTISSAFPAEIMMDSLLDQEYVWNKIVREDLNTGELFDKLQNREINFLICDHHEAILLFTFFSDLKIVKKVGPEFDRSWILKNGNNVLNEDINRWLGHFKESKKYESLYKKYFSQTSRLIHLSFNKSKYNRISEYDKIIKKIAKKYDFDWKYISSIIFQETKFYPSVTGVGGSFGLMQLMPKTGERFGVTEDSPVEEQVEAGVRYLAYLRKMYAFIDEKERLKFIAGAYNSGPGHIDDARQLCEKEGFDSMDWEQVSRFLALKSKKEYYTRPDVKHGYYPGSHTVKYVAQVMERYQAYSVAIRE